MRIQKRAFAVADEQALADVGKANWVGLELRHDRVYSIFSRMVLQESCRIYRGWWGGGAGVRL